MIEVFAERLQYLNISDNRSLLTLPANITRLSSLQHLDLSNNPQLFANDYFPTIVCSLPHLTYLNISNCELQSLPSELSQLRQLTTLHCANNRHLKVFPTVLLQLPQLQLLNLSG